MIEMDLSCLGAKRGRGEGATVEVLDPDACRWAGRLLYEGGAWIRLRILDEVDRSVYTRALDQASLAYPEG